MRIHIQPLKPSNQQPINTLDISPSGERLVLGQQTDGLGNAYLTLWGLADRRLQSEIESTPLGLVSRARFSPDGDTLAYVKNSSVYLYDLETQQTYKPDLYDPYVKWLAYAARHPRLVTSGFYTQVWDVVQRERLWTLQDPRVLPAERRDRPAIATLSPDGKLAAVAGPDTGQITIYDIGQNQKVQSLEGAPNYARWVSYDASGACLAVIERYAHGTFLWDVRNGERLLPHIFNAETEEYWSLSFHPDGEYLALGMLSGYVAIIRLKDGDFVVREQVHDGRVWDLSFMPDGKGLVSGGDDGTAYIWELS